MDREWAKWIELKAVRYCSESLLRKLRKQFGDFAVIGTRWVFIRKADGTLKARLVVQGCQEAPSSYRRDAPTCSPLAFMLVLAFAAQKGWTVGFFDAQAAFLQTEGISRLLVLRLPAENQPTGTLPNQLVIANASIYGTRDAPRAWYLRLKSILAELEIVEMQLEKSLFVWRDASGPRIVLATHVDDFIVAWRLADEQAAEKLESMKRKLRLKDVRGGSQATYCGKLVQIFEDRFCVSQPKALDDLEEVDISSQRQTEIDSKLTAPELTTYRSIWGQLSWLALQTRPDLAVETNLVAQRTEKATVGDLKVLNTLVRKALATRDRGLTIPRNRIDLQQAHIVYYGDSAFANAEGCKSQFGILGCLVSDVTKFVAGYVSLGFILAWHSATVKRVVRSTLAAEAYAVSEATEHAELLRYLLSEVYFGSDVLKSLEESEPKYPVTIVTDSHNLYANLPKDLTSIADKRLRIVIAMLRQTLVGRQFTELLWIRTIQMLADALTKVGISPDALVHAMNCTAFKFKLPAKAVADQNS